MSETPNHGYHVPDPGEEDWYVPLNENFAQYDIDIEIRDDAENIDSYEPKAGAKYFAVDTGEIFLGDGDAWQLKFSLSGDGVESLVGAEPDENGEINFASPNQTIEIGSEDDTVLLSVPDNLIDAFGHVKTVSGTLPDNEGNIDIASPDDSISIEVDADENQILLSVTGGTSTSQSESLVVSELFEKSDARLKQNVSSIANGLKTVQSLRPIRYERSDADSRESHLGLLAQEVEEVLPEIVGRYKEDDGDDDYLAINYARLVPVLVDAIQRQQATIDARAERIESLEERVEALERRQ